MAANTGPSALRTSYGAPAIPRPRRFPADRKECARLEGNGETEKRSTQPGSTGRCFRGPISRRAVGLRSDGHVPRLGGNGPFLVDRENERLIQMATSRPVRQRIADYERRLRTPATARGSHSKCGGEASEARWRELTVQALVRARSVPDEARNHGHQQVPARAARHTAEAVPPDQGPDQPLAAQ